MGKIEQDSYFAHYSSELRNLLGLMLRVQKDERPNIDEILFHPALVEKEIFEEKKEEKIKKKIDIDLPVEDLIDEMLAHKPKDAGPKQTALWKMMIPLTRKLFQKYWD